MSNESKGIQISEAQAAQYTKLPLNEQYAILMAHGDPEEFNARHAAALEDFKSLVCIPDLTSLGINWQEAALVLGTRNVTVRDSEGNLRRIGDIIIVITQNPANFHVHNISGAMHSKASETIFAHPHAMQNGQFCMGESRTCVMTAIADGRCSIAARILIAATWMRITEVNRGNAFHGAALQYWPVQEDS